MEITEAKEAEVNSSRITDAFQALTNQGGQCACNHQQSTVYQLTVRNYDLSAVGISLVNQVNVILSTVYTAVAAAAHDATIQVVDGADLSNAVDNVN